MLRAALRRTWGWQRVVLPVWQRNHGFFQLTAQPLGTPLPSGSWSVLKAAGSRLTPHYLLRSTRRNMQRTASSPQRPCQRMCPSHHLSMHPQSQRPALRSQSPATTVRRPRLSMACLPQRTAGQTTSRRIRALHPWINRCCRRLEPALRRKMGCRTALQEPWLSRQRLTVPQGWEQHLPGRSWQARLCSWSQSPQGLQTLLRQQLS